MYIYYVGISRFMLSPTEKKDLENRDALTPKVRANLDYRIAQKLKKNLSELDDINRALCSIPEKNAKRVLDDQMVAAIFRLTENMVRILGYVPVEEGDGPTIFVVRPVEILSRDAHSEEFKIRRELPTEQDMGRHYLLREHIEKLQKFANPEIHTPYHIKKSGYSYNRILGSSGDCDRACQEGYNLYRKWQEPK